MVLKFIIMESAEVYRHERYKVKCIFFFLEKSHINGEVLHCDTAQQTQISKSV